MTYVPAEPLPFIRIGYRWYDPSTGRFLQRDPIGIDGGLNVYAYCDGDPVSVVDPDGMDWGARARIWWNTRSPAEKFLDLTDPFFPKGSGDDEKAFADKWGQRSLAVGVGLAACAAGAGAAGFNPAIRYLPNAKGVEVTITKNIRAGWHWFKLRGKDVIRPHYHRRPGIGKHRPWEGGW
jgi:uncharacterized protein RhaS with RHS repeats